MPYIWLHNKVAVEKEELVPAFWNSLGALYKELYRYKDKPYGIKRLQSGGNGRKLLIDYDSLDNETKDCLGDPRQKGHILENYYQVKLETTHYYATFERPTGTLSQREQHQYTINASVLEAVLALRQDRIEERIKLNGSLRDVPKTLFNDAMSFNVALVENLGSEPHNLPATLRNFKNALKKFETDGLYSLIKDPHGRNKQNARKVSEKELTILKGLFAKQSHKPTATEVARAYDSFLNGYAPIYNKVTGELYDPKDFPKLSEATITNYLSAWENALAAHKIRSGNRQTYIGKYIPHGQMELPKYAGSLISVDDRQPPFWYEKGKRMWFYIGIDVASGCFTTFVYGKSKEGIILEFYRQMLRNYHEWGVNLPYELECESSLNSSFRDSFLADGQMFESVHMEANRAQSKIIERRFGSMRYEVEKKAPGWIARPHARKESNQAGPGKNQIIPYNELAEARLKDIEDWNNAPHHEDANQSRFEYFLNNQKQGLRSVNYRNILPSLGYKAETSCKGGYIQLQYKKRAIAEDGQILTGSDLIEKMKRIEGKDIDVYWLDDNDGNVLKAMAFIGDRYICEVMEMPRYQRAKIERTDKDKVAMELQARYTNTVISFANEEAKKIVDIGIEDKTPAPERKFRIRGVDRYTKRDTEPEVLGDITEEDQHILYNPSTGTENVKRWKQAYI